MMELGRILIFLGLLLVVVGLALVVLSRAGIPLGRLPGDLAWKGDNWSVSFPLVSSVLVSVLLSLILWVVNYFRR